MIYSKKNLLLIACLLVASSVNAMQQSSWFPNFGLSNLSNIGLNEENRNLVKQIFEQLLPVLDKESKPNIPDAIIKFSDTLAQLAQKSDEPSFTTVLIKVNDTFDKFLNKKDEGPSIIPVLEKMTQVLHDAVNKKDSGPTFLETLNKAIDTIKELLMRESKGPTFPEVLNHGINTLDKGIDTVKEILTKEPKGPSMTQAIDKFGQAALNFSVKEEKTPTLLEALNKGIDTVDKIITQESKGPSMPEALLEVNKTVQELNNTVKDNKVHATVNFMWKIDKDSIKTLLTAGVGCTLAIASILILYKAITQINAEKIDAEPFEKKSFLQKCSFLLKKVVTSPYMHGTAGLIAGLALIAKSDTIAQYI